MKCQDHISVCICTYRRPELLQRLLLKLQNQVVEGLFRYSVVVIDNDCEESGRGAFEEAAVDARVKMEYHVEPRQNIAMARNKAISKSRGDLIAFLDDDEFPADEWLATLYRLLLESGVDGVLGPVLPHFDGLPPEWLLRGGFCNRRTLPTGKILHWDEMRTGNVLLWRRIFDSPNLRFDERFGRSGGEDIDFFKKCVMTGHRFLWCNEGAVFETVPKERWKEKYYLTRYLRIGGLNGEMKRVERTGMGLLFKRVTGAVLYASVLPMCLFMGYHYFLKYACKLLYNISWIVGFAFVPVIRDREEFRKS